MAKRGETRPWRIRFQWEGTDIKGVETCRSLDEATALARQLERTSDLRGVSVSYAIQHRDQPEPERTVTHAPQDDEEV